MKAIRLFSFLAFVVLAVSCVNEIQQEQIISSEGITQITASFADGDSKTVLGSNGTSVLWSPGDEINVFYGKAKVKFTALNEEPSNVTIFGSSQSLMFIGSEGQSEYIWGAYPYSTDNSYDGNSVTITVPSEQLAVAGSFAPGAFPSIGRSKTTSMGFYNVCGGLKFSVSQSDIVSVVLKGTNKEIMAGTVKVGFDSDGHPTINEIKIGEDCVSLNAPKDSSFEVGAWYYLTILPKDFENGFSLEFVKSDGSRSVRKVPSKISVKRSVFGVMSEADKDLDFVKDPLHYLEFKSDGSSTVKLKNYGENLPILYYSIGSQPWERWDYSSIQFASGDTLKICGNNPDGFSSSETKYSTFQFEGDSVYVSKEVFALLNMSDTTSVIPCDYCFYKLFDGCSLMYNSWIWYTGDILHFYPTNTKPHCCERMFANSGMIYAYSLFNIKYAAKYAFASMYANCKSLMMGEDLTLELGGDDFCCYSMYYEDKALKWAISPEKAEWLGESACERMFQECSSLISQASIFAKSIGEHAFLNAWLGCSSVTKANIFTIELGSAALMGTYSNCTSLALIDASGFSKAPSWYDCWTWTWKVAPTGVFVKNVLADNWTVGDSGIPSGWTTIRNLSAEETANCYIVCESGNYTFNAMVKGNSTESVGNPASAEVLWESFGTDVTPGTGDLINNISLSDGYVRFSATEKKGNAVIAVKDDSGNILWSWHIWLTDQPTEQVYNNNAGTMMDRNLGATSATPGDVQALGLMYQWGRKDPFLGSSSISGDQEEAKSSTEWPSSVEMDYQDRNVDFAIEHPTTFIKSDGCAGPWTAFDLGEALWTECSTTKSKYDPCPQGWRVPDGGNDGIWSMAFNKTDYWITLSNWDEVNYGMDFGNTDLKLGSGVIWYPAAGYKLMNNYNIFGQVGELGRVWGAAKKDSQGLHYYFSLSNNGYVHPNNSSAIYPDSYGLSVRCQKD